MRWLLATLIMISSNAFADTPAASDAARTPLDSIAERYVHLTLEIGEREEGYVDAYYGPPAWAAQAKRAPRSAAELSKAAGQLLEALDQVDDAGLPPLELRRKRFLHAQLIAARTRLTMIGGKQLDFDSEAEGLYALKPQLRPLSDFDAALAQLDAALPGEGPLWQRVDSLTAATAIPPDKVLAVMHASIDECKRRTLRHIALPEGEKFTLELVTGQPWSGYNWYKGGATSLIQINTDLPVLMSRAVDLGCHEGYPGHHVMNMLLEERLSRGRGWIEFTVYPLYSPMSLIAEGSANYGIELAFPGDEKLAFERDVLYPLAGLDPALAAKDAALSKARGQLAGARLTVAREYLDGRIDRAEAVRLAQHYQLMSPQRAEQSISFVDRYRSYVINYGLGLDLVRAHVEAAGPDAAARWAAMEAILSEPTLSADLLPQAATR